MNSLGFRVRSEAQTSTHTRVTSNSAELFVEIVEFPVDLAGGINRDPHQ